MSKNSKKVKGSSKGAGRKGPVNTKKIIAGLFIATAVLTLVYWIVFHTTDFLKPVPMFNTFRTVQLLGSIWIGVTAVATAVELLREKDEATLWGLMAGATLILSALYNIQFNIGQGVYTSFGVGMGIETVGNLYTLILGIYAVNYFWKEFIVIVNRKAAPNLPVKKKRL